MRMICPCGNWGYCTGCKKEPKTILITGVLGFIFSNFIKRIIAEYPQYNFVGIDKAYKPYCLDNMFQASNYKFYLADMAGTDILNNIFAIEKPDIIINGAASSFVDDSITNIHPFIHDNIIGVQSLVDMALKYKVERFIHVSTDEVLGQKFNIKDEPWTELSPMAPRNPYSCTKASSEHIIMAAHYTHGLQFNITRSCNVFGPRQKKANLIPHICNALLKSEEIKIHGTGNNFRQWIYVDDKIDAIMSIIKNGTYNEIYNIGANNFMSNLEMVNYIAETMKIKPKIKFIEDRKAHDFGYIVSNKKLCTLGWEPTMSFKDGIQNTVNWYTNH